MCCLIRESLLTILNKTLVCKVKCLFEKDVLSYVHKVHKVCYMYFLQFYIRLSEDLLMLLLHY